MILKSNENCNNDSTNNRKLAGNEIFKKENVRHVMRTSSLIYNSTFKCYSNTIKVKPERQTRNALHAIRYFRRIIINYLMKLECSFL